MGDIEAPELQWFAVRIKRPNNPGRGTCVLGAEFEVYRNRQGKSCQRRVPKTGKRVFVPELLARRAGFEVFLPVRKAWRKTNRYKAERELVSYPLLVDWMFVAWPAGQARWHDLMALDVVTGVMGTGGRPVQIPEALMVKLMRHWGGGQLSPQWQRYMRRGNEFSVGDTVRVLSGPFEDIEALVEGISGPSAKVLVDLFGRGVSFEFEVDQLKPASK